MIKGGNLKEELDRSINILTAAVLEVACVKSLLWSSVNGLSGRKEYF